MFNYTLGNEKISIWELIKYKLNGLAITKFGGMTSVDLELICVVFYLEIGII